MAADHRAASQALRDAETRACAGVSEADRDWSPVSRARDVVSVTPLVDHVTVMRGAVERTSGVIITLRSVPGLSVESLQRIVDCHLARNSAMGHQVPELAECPLVPRGVTARVVRGSTGFDVEVRAADDGTLRDVQARAAALATRVGSAQ